MGREEVTPEEGKPAFYALAPGGWRDYWTLLHPPYTAWHLSYVAIGATVSPRFDGGRLGATVLAFFLAVGLTAHALDELQGRPLRTRIPDRVLQTIAAAGLLGAVALGVVGAVEVSWWLLAFVAFGAFAVVAYNLELIGARLHTDAWFALTWGAFPAVTSSFAQDGTIRLPAILVGAACMLLSVAQRTLSTPVRRLRRTAVRVAGEIEFADGSVRPLDEAYLRHAPERALRALSLVVPILALGLVLFRLGWP